MNTLAHAIKMVVLFCTVAAATLAAHSLSGIVADDPFPLKRASMPVENAVVYLSEYHPEQKGRFESVEQIVRAGLLDSTVTDQKGAYQFSDLSNATYIVSITHPDYRSAPVMFSVVKDTAINFNLIASGASTVIIGMVQLKKADGAGFVPLPECTISAQKALGAQLALDDFVPPKPPITVVTDGDGYFTITSIPFTANGEKWTVSASRNGKKQSSTVTCYNETTDTAEFIFSESYANSASVTFGGAIFTLSANKDEYHWHESVEVRYRITNPTSSAITFDSFTEGCEYDFIVTLSNGQEVYRESVARICPAMTGSVTVNPGETVTHTFSSFDISEELAAVRKDTIKVNLQARLMGVKYTMTLVEVPVTIYFDAIAGTFGLQEKRSNAAVSFNAAQNILTFKVATPQNVSVRLYSLVGSVLPHGSIRWHLSAGIQTCSLQRILRHRALGSGSYIIEVSGADFGKRFFTVNILK